MHAALQHGSNVAFQLKASKIGWLTCHDSSECGLDGTFSYAGMYQFNSDPRTNFVVYRKNGPGTVVVGDVIALYHYKISGRWFSMLGCKGKLSTCPGSPSAANGMATDNLWYQCLGEAFKIYAKDKKLGDAIVANDDIQLYYLGEGHTVNAWSDVSCFDNADPTRPPRSTAYHPSITMEIWIA